MREVVIVEAARTGIGAFGGGLSGVSAASLGAQTIQSLMERSGVQPSEIDEVIMGHVLQAGLGQNTARQAAIHAGLPESVPAFAVNKVCGSGLKSITLGALSIAAGEADCVIAGGMENMSQAPHFLLQARQGYRLGSGELVDSILHDGLTDAFHQIHMGVTAENIAKRYGITRDESDQYALHSQAKAKTAWESGRFEGEIIPVQVPQKKGEPLLMDRDESPRPDTTAEKLAKLRPAFQEGGIVTAGSASTINDGAAAVLLMSADRAMALGLRPLARIAAYASAGCDPRMMGLGPVPAVRDTLRKAGWEAPEVDLFELNEAFAPQAIAVMRELGLSPDSVNVNGGAIALGHPIGASGARIVVTLLHEMRRRGSIRGIASLCIGGGQGIAIALEQL